jgi:hypothetical protein
VEEQERQERVRRIAERLAERLEQEWPEGDLHINEIEELAERLGRDVMRDITREVLPEPHRPKPGNQRACACGKQARYRGMSGLTLVTTHGRLRVRRAYYYCAACGTGHCPLDREWGLGPGNTTPAVQDLVAALSAHVPYVQVPALLRRVGSPVRLGVKTIELVTQALGKRIEAAAPAGPEHSGRRIAVAVDGVMLPTRAGYKEARCGVVYEPAWNPARTPAAEAELRKEYLATLSGREHFMAAVCQRVEARRPDPREAVGALGDGAAWIWEGYAAHLPHRVEILDFYHALEHVGIVAAAMHGEGTPEATAWQQRMKGNLLRYGPGTLLRALREWRPGNAETTEVRRQQLGYFERNQRRMDYPTYRKWGLPIGSGAVEGACKHLVADRFKGAGMRWNVETAEPVLHLRAALLTHPNLDLKPYAGPTGTA